jgi:hypothetical protein
MANYRLKQLVSMQPWDASYSMEHVHVTAPDKANGHPKMGDMISDNPKHPSEKWLISKEYFEENYTWVNGYRDHDNERR